VIGARGQCDQEKKVWQNSKRPIHLVAESWSDPRYDWISSVASQFGLAESHFFSSIRRLVKATVSLIAVWSQLFSQFPTLTFIGNSRQRVNLSTGPDLSQAFHVFSQSSMAVATLSLPWMAEFEPDPIGV
jgi:hypothetical protein